MPAGTDGSGIVMRVGMALDLPNPPVLDIGMDAASVGPTSLALGGNPYNFVLVAGFRPATKIENIPQ